MTSSLPVQFVSAIELNETASSIGQKNEQNESVENSGQTVQNSNNERERENKDLTISQPVVSEVTNDTPIRSDIEGIEVVVESISIPLGSNQTTIDARSMIKEVKFDGISLNSNQYNAEVTRVGETRQPGSSTVEIKVEYGALVKVVNVPVTVIWGSSICIFGSVYTEGATNRPIAAYTWHPNYGITYVPGQIGSSLTSASYNSAGSTIISRLSVFSGNTDITINTTLSVFDFEIHGHQTPNAVAENFRNQTNQENAIYSSVGDVVESWHRNENNQSTSINWMLVNRQWNILMRNEEIVDTTGGLNSAYYEITTDGFRPLVINQTTGKDGIINRHTTNSELDQQLHEYLNLPEGVTPVGFIDYPEREQLGETTGTIRVSEMLHSGKKIFYDVTINFEVTLRDSSLVVDVNPQEVSLGMPNEMIDASSLVNKVTFDGFELNDNEYVIEILGEIAPLLPETNRQLLVQITHDSYSTQIAVPIEVVWGNSLRVSGSWSESTDFRTVAAYTWHPEYGITYVPGQGSSSLTTSSLPQVGLKIWSRLSIYSGNENISIGETTEAFKFEIAGNESPNDIVEKFEAQTDGSNKITASIGDVVESWHIYKTDEETGNSITSGRQWNLQMVDEQMVDQSGGGNSVYYELTDTGYQPLDINKTKSVKKKITRHITDVELEDTINNYLNLPNGVTAVCFEEYPDRTSLGEKQGKIKVEEILISGKKIQCDIIVDFSVVASEDDWIEVTIPLKAMFYGVSGIQSGIQEIESPKYAFTNHSSVPITMNIESVQNETTINRLLLLHLHGEPIPYDVDLIVAGRVLSVASLNDVFRIGMEETEEIEFTGEAFFFTEEANPYFEIVFKVTS